MCVCVYTTLPHDKLIEVLHKIVDFCFTGGTKKSIVVTACGVANWKGTTSGWTLPEVKSLVDFLVRQANFSMGDLVMRQCIGIAMGLDPAPFFANLFLFHYESTWILEKKKKCQREARSLGHTFRFIDDLLTVNDGGIFAKVWNEIYPPELELKHENKISTEASFLDLELLVKEKKLKTKLYDKRDGFNFQIVRMPFLESCIPDRIFYATIMSEVLRIARATTHREDLKSSTETLLERMRDQGADDKCVRTQLCKMMQRHREVFEKFDEGIMEYLIQKN